MSEEANASSVQNGRKPRTTARRKPSTTKVTIQMTINDEAGWQRLARVLSSALTEAEQRQMLEALKRRIETEPIPGAAEAPGS